ncbi:MAG: helix-turn-helix domain-containing protein [Elusimicrobia bacterium]|nr:helix-turn-helix domain-containing protein [Elusimicrobiota bacterium]
MGQVGPVNPTYAFLVARYPPREIVNRREHHIYRDLVSALLRALNSDGRSKSADGVRRYLSVLTPFVERFENRHWPSGKTKGREVLSFLMEQNELTQESLAKEIGSQPYVSDILNGKKKLTAEQIRKLSRRFGVSPAVFFDA